MKKILMVFLFLFPCSCNDNTQTIKESVVIRRLIQDYTSHPNWNIRKEKKRQLISQGPEVIPYLWEACDTDYFEELHRLLIMLKNLRAFSEEEWEQHKKKLHQSIIQELQNPDPSRIKNLINQLSLLGSPEDTAHLVNFLKSPDKEIQGLALATIYRLGFPYEGPQELDEIITRASLWSIKEAPKLTREPLLWQAFKNSKEDPVYRQTIVQGLIHYAVAHPKRRPEKSTLIWNSAKMEADSHIRVDLVLLLGVLGDQRIKNNIIDAHWLQSPDLNLRIATSWSLNQLGFSNPQPK